MFEQLLRPILQLAIKSGLRYGDLDTILRAVLFDEARNECEPSKRTNASSLSMMTGLHRKEVASLLGEADKMSSVPGRNQRKRDIASQVFEYWARQTQRNPSRRSLSVLASSPRGESFVAMTKRVVSDVHPRAVLDELVRLGVVSEENGRVTLVSETFTPAGASDDRIPLMIDNAGAMLRTCGQNSIGVEQPQLEQAIWGEGITLEDAQKLDAIARSQWNRSRKVLFDAISRAPEAPPSSVRYRARIGMYVNYEVVPRS
jgi:Family of unknown function (DUF6502)